jgi:hypothetical protein
MLARAPQSALWIFFMLPQKVAAAVSGSLLGRGVALGSWFGLAGASLFSVFASAFAIFRLFFLNFSVLKRA